MSAETRSPGLVCTVFNWARPRDLSHYETFEHYHATFYKHVEAAVGHAVLAGGVAAGSGGTAGVAGSAAGQWSSTPNEAASRIQASDPYVRTPSKPSAARAELVGDGTAVADFCRAQLRCQGGPVEAEAQNTTGGRTLTYTEPRGGDGPKRGTTINLLHHPGLERVGGVHLPEFAAGSRADRQAHHGRRWTGRDPSEQASPSEQSPKGRR